MYYFCRLLCFSAKHVVVHTTKATGMFVVTIMLNPPEYLQHLSETSFSASSLAGVRSLTPTISVCLAIVETSGRHYYPAQHAHAHMHIATQVHIG